MKRMQGQDRERCLKMYKGDKNAKGQDRERCLKMYRGENAKGQDRGERTCKAGVELVIVLLEVARIDWL